MVASTGRCMTNTEPLPPDRVCAQELILLPTRLFRRVTRLPQLPTCRSELREYGDQALILLIEVAVERVRDHPYGPDGAALQVEGEEQRLHEARLITAVR